MKKTINILAVLCMVCLAGTSCRKTEPQLFADRTGVYFQLATYEFSFSEYPGETEFRISIPIKVMGRLSGEERHVKAELYTYEKVEDEETNQKRANTADPSTYEILEGVIPGDSVGGAFYVNLKYSPELEEDTRQFHINIVPNDDFPEALYNSTPLKIVFSAKEMRPANWIYLQSFFGTYSTSWWKFIKETTGRTSFPYWGYNNPDPELWWMEYDEVAQWATIVKRALRDYNQRHPDAPLTHDDGEQQGEEVVMP